MRSDDQFEIRLLSRPHKFFVYWIGRPDYHIMDWTGCNFHWVKAENQPKGGFDTPWDAWLWADRITHFNPTKVYDEIDSKSGSFLQDKKRYDAELYFEKGSNTPRFRIKCPLNCKVHEEQYVDSPSEWLKLYEEHMQKREKESKIRKW